MHFRSSTVYWTIIFLPDFLIKYGLLIAIIELVANRVVTKSIPISLKTKLKCKMSKHCRNELDEWDIIIQCLVMPYLLLADNFELFVCFFFLFIKILHCCCFCYTLAIYYLGFCCSTVNQFEKRFSSYPKYSQNLYSFVTFHEFNFVRENCMSRQKIYFSRFSHSNLQ